MNIPKLFVKHFQEVNNISQILFHNNGANLPWLLLPEQSEKIFGRDVVQALNKKALYYRLRRLLFTLSENNFCTFVKIDGLDWFFPKAELSGLLAQLHVDLIDLMQNSNSANSVPRRLSEERYKAVKFLKNTHWLKEKGLEYIRELFDQYLQDRRERVLFLRKIEPTGDPDTDDLFLAYKHRFLPYKLAEIRRKFEEIWGKASARHNIAVFWTVTMDPRKDPNLYDGNKEIMKSFNRLNSWLKKRLESYEYIKVTEFQLDRYNGRIHFHMVFFGVDRIGDKFTELTPEIEKIGFGKISYLYQIRKDRKGEWHWLKAQPSDARNRSPKDYLKKYINKATSSKALDVHSLYWSMNVRFFTYSRTLKLDSFTTTHEVSYVFVSSFNQFEVPMFLLEKYESVYRRFGRVEHPRHFVRGGTRWRSFSW